MVTFVLPLKGLWPEMLSCWGSAAPTTTVMLVMRTWLALAVQEICEASPVQLPSVPL